MSSQSRTSRLVMLVGTLLLASSLPSTASAEVIRYRFSGFLDYQVDSALAPAIEFGDRFRGTLMYDTEALPWGFEQDNNLNARYRAYLPASTVRARFGDVRVNYGAGASVMDAYGPDLTDGIDFVVGMPDEAPVINGYKLTMLSLRLFTLEQDYWSTTALPARLPRLADVNENWFSGFWTSWTRGEEVVFASGHFERIRVVPEPSTSALTAAALGFVFVSFKRRRQRL